MNYLRIRAVPVFFILFFIATPPTVYGWYDETHLRELPVLLIFRESWGIS